MLTFLYLVIVLFGFVDVSARNLTKDRIPRSETERMKDVNVKVYFKVYLISRLF